MFAFFEITAIISWRASNKLLVGNPLASTLRIHSSSAHYTVLAHAGAAHVGAYDCSIGILNTHVCNVVTALIEYATI